MCCPSLPVTSPHCDVRPRGGGGGKDSHKDGQAAVDQAGGKVCGKGLDYQLLLWRLDPKGCGNSPSHDRFPFQDLPFPRAPLCRCLRGFPQAELMCGGHQPFSQGFFFFLSRHPFTEDLRSGSMGMSTSQVLLSWDSSCPMLSCVCWGRRARGACHLQAGLLSVQSEPCWHLAAGSFWRKHLP